MAKLKFLQAAGGGGTGWEAKYYGISNDKIFEVLDSDNFVVRQVFYGTGLNGWSNSGNITAIDMFSEDGKVSVSLTGLDFTMGEYRSSFSIGNSSAGYWLLAQRGNDTVTGSRFDDILLGSRGTDNIDGGVGSDTLSYRELNVQVTANLTTKKAVTAVGTASIKNIENLQGSSYADTLIGDTKANVFQGFGGNDTIKGGDGVDTAIYRDLSAAVIVNLGAKTATSGAAVDTLDSIETVVGSRFADDFLGTSRAESFDGFLGNDTIDGGTGTDTVLYDYSVRSVTVDLTAGTATGGAGNDTLKRIENVVGSDFADIIRGSSAANTLRGGEGNDQLAGRNGKDVLVGNTGADQFLFTAVSDSAATAAGADRIADFSRAQGDKISLKSIDAITGGADSKFEWIGKAAFSHKAGELHYSTTDGNAYVSGDVDGNGTADFVIRVDKVVSLAATDFIL